MFNPQNHYYQWLNRHVQGISGDFENIAKAATDLARSTQHAARTFSRLVDAHTKLADELQRYNDHAETVFAAQQSELERR